MGDSKNENTSNIKIDDRDKKTDAKETSLKGKPVVKSDQILKSSNVIRIHVKRSQSNSLGKFKYLNKPIFHAFFKYKTINTIHIEATVIYEEP